MKRIFTYFLAVLFVSHAYGQADRPDRIRAKYDERIELMSIICHLAGFQEYNMDMGGDYIEDIDSYFADVKNHPAIEMMDSLRRHKGISYDAPMAFAISLTKKGDDFIIVNDTVTPEKRWKGLDLKKAAATISDFYVKSNFSDFFDSHRPFYEKICALFDSNITSRFNQNWYEKFYGMPPTDNFNVVIGFVNGGANYGPSFQLPGQPRNVYAIIGYALDDNGESYFFSKPETYLGTMIHEFNHSFVNDLTDNPEFSSGIASAGKAVLQYCRKVMRRNAYSSWETLVNESIVRAAVIMYLLENGAKEEDIRKNVVDEMSVGFNWTPELVKCLQNYSRHRDRYPSLDLYYPEIIDFFNNYADNCAGKIDAIFK